VSPRKVANPRRTATFYRGSADARRVKAVKDNEVNGRPDQLAKRRELAAERRKRNMMGKGGSDLSHTKSGKLVKENPSSNRARNRSKK
jgi:hypothetical protein